MNRIKRILSLTILLMCISLFGCQKQKEEIHIFYTSDVHCGLEENINIASLKALVDERKLENKNVLLVDAGDFLQGSNLGLLTKGQSIINIMNNLDYDYVTIGNHEFDYGLDRLKELLDQASFNIVVSNSEYSGNKEDIFKDFPEYYIHDFNGTKIAFIGIVTPTSITSSTPSYFKENGEFVYDFYGGDEGNILAEKIQSVVDEVRSQKVDYVIALSHLGSIAELQPYDSISFISKTSGIDAVIDGHSHSVIVGDTYVNKDGEEVLITSVGTKLENIGELIIDNEGNISSLLISSYDKEDENILKVVKEENLKIENILNEVLCNVDFDLPISDENGLRLVRNREVALADLVADSIRDYFNSDIALVNGGGVRADLLKGEVSVGDLIDINPFGNTVAHVKASGQMILDALEFGSRFTQALATFDDKSVGESGAFLQVSGLKFSVDTSIESTIVIDENNMLKEIGENRRVKDVYVLKGDEYVPLDPNEYYTVSGSTYVLLENGDGCTAFEDAELIESTNYTLPDVMKEYIKKNNGISEIYSTNQNRIIIE